MLANKLIYYTDLYSKTFGFAVLWWAEEIIQGFKKLEETVYIARKWKPPSLKDDSQTNNFPSTATYPVFCSFEYENDTKLYQEILIRQIYITNIYE